MKILNNELTITTLFLKHRIQTVKKAEMQHKNEKNK